MPDSNLNPKGLGKWGILKLLGAIAIISIVYNIGKNVINFRTGWGSYDSKYGISLPLPHDMRPPHVEQVDLPGSTGPTLWIQVYRTDAKGDAQFRNWIKTHDGFSPWKSTQPSLPPPLGEWEATKGKMTLIFSRLDDSGWAQVTLVERPPVPNTDKPETKAATSAKNR